MKKRLMINDEKFIQEIKTFYEEQGRHALLWRKNQNGYRVLVSEIMLQQTQVRRVTEKYTEWIKRYPSLTELGKASLQEILLLWQGLGYQRRAKALYRIGKEYTVIPKTYDELLKLPGVGPYTASAIMAFAYNTFSFPVLETNIRTALIEEFHQGEERVHDGVLYDDLTRLSTYDAVEKMGARNWYYALMDYGAYLKENKISHNHKSEHYSKQTVYKGSHRELRAKVLFAITHGNELPDDERLEKVLEELMKESFVHKSKNKYTIVK